METKAKTKILCVDDERAVLDGLTLHLRRKYEVLTAQSGAQGLEIVGQDPTVAVIISDMRMPGMDGATFLAKARQVLPDAVRILLTGQADMSSAIAAINEGQIFRFLTKPCPPPTILASVEAAAEMNRLVTAERVLLEQTLHGSIKALTDILALTSPVAFGRATRIKQLVADMAAKLDIREKWQVEVAAMLSQLGTMTLPPETIENLYYGRPLSEAEQKMVARAPAVTEQLVRNIPRLEVVADILEAYGKPHKRSDSKGEAKPEHAAADARKQIVEQGAALLRIALDFDTLEAQGNTPALALGTLKARHEQYDARVLGALFETRGSAVAREEVREVTLAVLCAGMVFVDDVKTQAGTLLVARGFEVTRGFLERARNFAPGMVKEPLRVILRKVA